MTGQHWRAPRQVTWTGESHSAVEPWSFEYEAGSGAAEESEGNFKKGTRWCSGIPYPAHLHSTLIHVCAFVHIHITNIHAYSWQSKLQNNGKTKVYYVYILQTSLKTREESAASVAQQRDQLQKKLQDKEVRKILIESLAIMPFVTSVAMLFVVCQCQAFEVTNKKRRRDENDEAADSKSSR